MIRFKSQVIKDPRVRKIEVLHVTADNPIVKPPPVAQFCGEGPLTFFNN